MVCIFFHSLNRLHNNAGDKVQPCFTPWLVPISAVSSLPIPKSILILVFLCELVLFYSNALGILFLPLCSKVCVYKCDQKPSHRQQRLKVKIREFLDYLLRVKTSVYGRCPFRNPACSSSSIISRRFEAFHLYGNFTIQFVSSIQQTASSVLFRAPVVNRGKWLRQFSSRLGFHNWPFTTW